MAIFVQYDWFVFLLVGLGTMALLSEVLTNLRGISAIIGIFVITVYFYFYVSNTSTFILMFIVYFIGLLLIIIDGKLIGDGTLGIFGVLTIFISVAVAAPNFTASLYAIVGVIVGVGLAFLSLKLFPRRNMWKKLTLRDRLTEEKGYSTLSKEYANLKNKQGITITDLRPSGSVRIKGKDYSVVSTGVWIEKGTKVVVTEVDGTKIVVQPLDV